MALNEDVMTMKFHMEFLTVLLQHAKHNGKDEKLQATQETLRD
jgi:hypothetical protein